METQNKLFAKNIYYDQNFDLVAAKILPGEYYVTDEDMVIVTVLGSCVSACVRDRVSRIGGMNHFMLPQADENGLSSKVSLAYGMHAMDSMIEHLLQCGAKRENLEAKVFGGGIISRFPEVAEAAARNANFIRQYLGKKGIPAVAEDANNEFSRKVYFFPNSGKVLVKKIRATNNNTVRNREADYAMALKKAMDSVVE